MTKRRREQLVPDELIVYKLNALTASVAQSSCHACARTNQGLTFTSRRQGCGGAAITICKPCLTDVVRYYREYLESQRKPV